MMRQGQRGLENFNEQDNFDDEDEDEGDLDEEDMKIYQQYIEEQ